MKGERSWTIAIRPPGSDKLCKITKIVGLNGGGFSVLAPYHKAKSGFLWKMPIPPDVRKPGTHHVASKMGTAFTASDRVKLSYHTDGFAQFSSETSARIISGIDPATGEPKGLGLYTRPLTSPISSGPSIGVTVWGMEEFEDAKGSDRPLIFEADEFYYRRCTPAEATAWMLSIFVFPVDVAPPVRFRQGQELLDIAADPAHGRLMNVIQLKLMRLRKERVFLGAYVNAVKGSAPVKSGWIFNGPGNHGWGLNGHVLMGIYPRDEKLAEGRASLDREPTAESATSE